MTSTSTLPASAMQASKAALSAAFSEDKDLNGSNDSTKSSSEAPANGEEVEEGEIQEIDMESQAEGIRTVFSDPTNFNVKVCCTPAIHWCTLN